jgi:hypothetical protein
MKRRRLPLSLSEEEIYGQLGKALEADTLFLRRYPGEIVWRWLQEAGILERLQRLGYDRLELSLRAEDGVSRLTLEQAGEPARLIDLRLAEQSQVGTLALKTFREPLAFLVIEWISLQHPRGSFSRERPRLPGQDYPGLGVGRALFALLARIARELGKDGLLGYPQYYHNAVFYFGSFVFAQAREQGIFLALRRDLGKLELVEASNAVGGGAVIELRSGKPLEWKPGEMIFPLSRRLKAQLARSEYRLEVERTLASVAFGLAAPARAPRA